MATTKILVVDDNVDAAVALSLLLQLDGHEVRQAHDGVDAFEVARDFAPQIGIFDLDMPRRDGYELARLVREQPWGKSMVLVTLTGHDDRATRNKATANGFDLFFRKPIDPVGFGGLIQSILSDPPAPPIRASAESVLRLG